MVPVLSLVLPYSHLESVATSLATIVLVASFNSYNFNKKSVIVWKVVPFIAVTSTVFAFTSAYFATELPLRILLIIFLLFLIWVAARTFLIKKQDSVTVTRDINKLVPPGIGTLSGFISGLTGIGGGGITTPLMLITRLVNNVQAAPTSNAIMIFTALFGCISYAIKTDISNDTFVSGYVHFDTAFLLFLSSALFSKFGVNLNQKFPLFWRKTILGLLLLFLSFRIVFMLINT